MIGILVNLACGLIVFFIAKNLFEWLPNRTQLQNRFQKVAQEKGAHQKIVQLTPLVFISFFWLFIGNMTWAVSSVIYDFLSWPDTVLYMNDYKYIELTTDVVGALKSEMATLIISRWVLWFCIFLFTIFCYWRGIAIAKQCWEVYKELDV